MNPFPVTEHLCCFVAFLAERPHPSDRDIVPLGGSEYANLTGPPRSLGALLSPHSEESGGGYLPSKTDARDTTQDQTPHHDPCAFPDKNSGHFIKSQKGGSLGHSLYCLLWILLPG